MSAERPVLAAESKDHLTEVYLWFAQVLTGFAMAEQAIGQLCLRLDLPITNGPLGSVENLCRRLASSESRHCKALEKRIRRWQSLRPVRHVLAHATLQLLYDEHRNLVVVSRHLPRDKDDATPDRVWTIEERKELRRIVSSDARSIQDQVRNLLADNRLIEELRKF